MMMRLFTYLRNLTFKGKIAFDLNDKIAKSKDNKLQIEVGFWGSDTEIIELK